MSEIELTDTQLNAFLNLCYLKGKRNFSLYSPLLDLDLFEIELRREEWSCVPSFTREELRDKIVETRNQVPSHLKDDVPGYDDLRNAMIASGAFGPAEFGDEVANVMKRLKGKTGKYAICLDTNALYNRFVSSVLYPAFEEEDFTHMPEVILSHLVVDEVRNKANRRYGDVEDLVRVGGGALRDLEGEYKLASRQAKIALTELDFIDEEMRTLYHGDEEFVDDNEERDVRIIKEYEDSREETGKKPLLLGFERDFGRKVMDYDVHFVPLDYPVGLYDAEIGHENLYLLLRYASQVYGSLELRGVDCRLLGVWDGIHDSEFEEGKVKIVFEDEDDLFGELEEEVEISDRLRNSVG